MEKIKSNKHTTELGYLGITRHYEGSDGKWYVEGYASTADIDSRSDRITLDALRGAKDNLVNNYGILLFNHDSNSPTGRVVNAEVDARGLKITAFISKQAEKVWEWVKEGVINSFSIGGFIVKAVKFFDKEVNQMVREIRRLELVEVSLVSLPANPYAKTTGFYVGKALDVVDLEDLTEKSVEEAQEEEIKQEVDMTNEVTKDVEATEEEVVETSSDEEETKDLEEEESEVTEEEESTDEPEKDAKIEDEVEEEEEEDEAEEDEDIDPDLVEDLVDEIVEKVETKLLPILEAKITSIIEEKMPKKKAKEAKGIKEAEHPKDGESLEDIMNSGDEDDKKRALDSWLAGVLRRR